MYMSVERMNRLITDKGIVVINGVCDKLGLPQFRRAEVAFIAEYVSVMKPLIQALDILQCETTVYMAYLLPTRMTLKEKMQFLLHNSSIKCCKPMVVSMDTAINSRFSQYIMNAKLIGAAIVHPNFSQIGSKTTNKKELIWNSWTTRFDSSISWLKTVIVQVQI